TLNQLDNTLIIFTSDNGYLLGQHRWSGKILPYEASLRVPLLMRGPRIPAGVRVRDSTALVDVAATIADAAGAVPRLTVDGRSLLPLARGQVDAQGYGALSIESGQQGWSGADARWFYQGVRTRRYTYVSYLRTGELELYDRRQDPDELTNVAYRPAYRRTRDALAGKLRGLHDCAGADCLDVSGQVPRPRAEPYLDNGATVHPDDLGSIGRARQVVTVTARNWSAGTGRATAWQRRGRTWTVRRGPFPVILGGRGLVRAQDRRAGSGQTPAGTFRPGFALGHLRDPGTALSYRRFDENDYWAMDPRAPRAYNVYQPRHSPRSTWRTRAAERWRDHRSRYPYAMVMQYNLPRRISHSRRFDQMQAAVPADVRRGSLVLHVGRRLSHHGWTSMDRGEMRWLLRWMHPDRMHTRFVLGTPSYLRKHL
ncbi:MAG: sulfatase/phosphatase domain-containing protein, partial [Nocardioidaceae bacterium]